jgi:hypothetical protein
MAEVLRRHREIAVLARFASASNDERHWIETGEDRGLGSCGFDLVARLIAEAEARGRDAERAQTTAGLRGESDHEKEIAANVAFVNGYAREVGKYRPSLGEAVDWALSELAARIDREEHLVMTPEHEAGGEGSE